MLQPIGIYNGELYLAENDFNGTQNMCVLRYITKDDLEYKRSYTGTRECVEEIWREQVYIGDETCSLDEYVEQVLNYDVCGDEDYVGKDSSWCEVFDYHENLRKMVDDYILQEYDDEVGTWEASGCYTPKAKFDLVIDEKLAEEYYKAENIKE